VDCALATMESHKAADSRARFMLHTSCGRRSLAARRIPSMTVGVPLDLMWNPDSYEGDGNGY
jgi:hypothetical protein